MTEQYVDAAGEERFEAAVSLTLQRLADDRAVRLEEAAAGAVLQTFCLCVTVAEDEIEHHLSSVHAGVVADVIQRARIILTHPAAPRSRGSATRAERDIRDAVDLASDQSFPASDPPAWIESRPPRPAGEGSQVNRPRERARPVRRAK